MFLNKRVCPSKLDAVLISSFVKSVVLKPFFWLITAPSAPAVTVLMGSFQLFFRWILNFPHLRCNWFPVNLAVSDGWHHFCFRPLLEEINE